MTAQPVAAEVDPTLNAVPEHECDLVMKGGVTSGVVYPPAVLALCRRYRFRCIGGASAGAIAAAAAAAAEYGRQGLGGGALPPGAPACGFVGLAQLNAELARPGFVRSLFRPSEPARPLLEAFLAGQTASRAAREQVKREAEQGRSPGWLRRHLRQVDLLDGVLAHAVPWGRRTGWLLGLLVAELVSLGTLAWGVVGLLSPGAGVKAAGLAALLVTLVLWWVGARVGALLGGGVALARVLARLQDKGAHKFGICPGSDGVHARLDGESLALVDWLHVRFNQLAGLAPDAPPLTVRQLRERGVEFKLVTTNLSLGQPYIIPLQRGSRSFFFKRSELERLFPPPVVEALVAWGRANRPDRSLRIPESLADELYRFPLGEDLPLVVATRLSLAFPVLLSAVRLYSVRPALYDKGADGKLKELDPATDLEEHWFSDGGITSNFPIHVFDAWVPQRPTFGITLYDSPIPTVLGQLELQAPGDTVVLPAPREFDKARPQRIHIGGLLDFLRAIFETGQSYRDNAQSGLPSYRERIVQVFLDPTEGGLNLDMLPGVIGRIQEKGQRAAKALLDRYADAGSDAFSEHRWVRMLVLMAELERRLEEVRVLAGEPDQTGRFPLFREQLAARAGESTRWYRARDARWCDEAQRRLEALLGVVTAWEQSHAAWTQAGARPGASDGKTFFSEHPPRPQGVLKVTPDA